MSEEFYTAQRPKTEIGGKAFNIFEIEKAGISVPRFVVVPASRLTEEIFSIDGVIDHFKDVEWLAVRSSATAEDGTEHSFAGLFATRLFVKRESLARAIGEVAASASAKRVQTYLRERKIETGISVSVIVQEMIDADSAGVAFSRDPVSQERKVVINSVFGLGEGLVSGDLTADVFTVGNGGIGSSIAPKDRAYRLKPKEGGVEIKPVDEPLRKSPSLTDGLILALAGKTEALEARFGSPQDVEWAVKDGEIFILQSRPITTLRAPDTGERIVWDNSNIIESYPGLTSPLTFSFIVKMYAAVYREMIHIMGVSRDEIESNAFIFDNMLGLLKGRVYYNLVSWYRALALLPGYDLNADFMERMMGVKERFDLPGRKKKAKLAEYVRIGRMALQMLGNYRRLPSGRERFHRTFEGVLTEYARLDFDAMSETELMHRYLALEGRLTKKWQAPLVNDFFAMIFFGATQKMTEKYGLPEGIHNDLLSGSRDIISTEHVSWSLRITGMIRARPHLESAYRDESPAAALEKTAGFPEVQNEIDLFLKKFGDRTVGELKLETVTLKQEPEKYIRILQNYIKSGVGAKRPDGNGEELRRAAETRLNERLKGKFLKRKVYRFFLKRARVLVSERENLRFERTRAFGVVREIFVALGQRFYRRGVISDPRDVFYLKMDEVFDYVKGTGSSPSFKDLVRLRKADYASFGKLSLPERIETTGVVGDDFGRGTQAAIIEGDLKGIGCCPGVVRAKVQVIGDPSETESLNGDILVTASTDPGWISLFPGASGILVERGSLLSHSAIVSREMGKPCIVAVEGLLATLRTGDMVEMDGSTGVIRRIEAGD